MWSFEFETDNYILYVYDRLGENRRFLEKCSASDWIIIIENIIRCFKHFYIHDIRFVKMKKNWIRIFQWQQIIYMLLNLILWVMTKAIRVQVSTWLPNHIIFFTNHRFFDWTIEIIDCWIMRHYVRLGSFSNLSFRLRW